MTRIWFITAAANGLGRSITEEALRRGDKVAATARRPAELDDLAARFGDAILPLALDVRDAAAATEAVDQAVTRFGRLDVVVNNAGYAAMLPFEDMTPESFRDQMDTNFYGTVYVTHAVLPHLRRQRSGHILQISSVGGRMATPGLSAYQAAKWAAGGFSGVLAAEVKHLGIKVTVVEPGGMATNWAARAMEDSAAISADYQESVGAFLRMRRDGTIKLKTSDPARVASILADLAGIDDAPLKLLIGSDAFDNARKVEDARRAVDESWEHVSRSSDADADGYAPMPHEAA
jgi:NAD(P)-dependent dehydrogenase (short-subunit alcohol dehydrogenase family)